MSGIGGSGLLGSRQLSVRRPAKGTYVDGVYVKGADASLTVVGALQPLNFREIEMLPEGQRQRARFKLYTYDLMQIATPEDETIGDRVDVDDLTLIVHGLADYANALPQTFGTLQPCGVNHRKYLLLLPRVP